MDLVGQSSATASNRRRHTATNQISIVSEPLCYFHIAKVINERFDLLAAGLLPKRRDAERYQSDDCGKCSREYRSRARNRRSALRVKSLTRAA